MAFTEEEQKIFDSTLKELAELERGEGTDLAMLKEPNSGMEIKLPELVSMLNSDSLTKYARKSNGLFKQV